MQEKIIDIGSWKPERIERLKETLEENSDGIITDSILEMIDRKKIAVYAEDYEAWRDSLPTSQILLAIVLSAVDFQKKREKNFYKRNPKAQTVIESIKFEKALEAARASESKPKAVKKAKAKPKYRRPELRSVRYADPKAEELTPEYFEAHGLASPFEPGLTKRQISQRMYYAKKRNAILDQKCGASEGE